MERTSSKEEGLRKLERNGDRTFQERDPGQNNGGKPQLRLIERFWELLMADNQDNLHCPLVADSRDIWLRYHSKGECIRSCTGSHATLRFQTRNNIIRFIMKCQAHLEPERKRKSNGSGGRGAYRGQQGWNMRGDNGFHGQNPDGHTRGKTLEVVLEGVALVKHVSRTDITDETGVREGAKGTITNPPTKTDKVSGTADITIGKEVSRRRW